MSEIRSVSVHLDADVTSYIAKMRLAGAETDKAFNSGVKSIGGVNDGLSNTETRLKSVDRTLSQSNGWTTYAKKLDTFTSKLVTLPGLALGATAALQPLAAAGLAVGAAFAAPIAFTGGGLTLFGILGGFALKQTNSQLQKIDQLQAKLKTLKKGTADYALAQQQLAAAQKALTPAQREYGKSLDNLHSSFDRLLGGKSGATLLGPISDSLNLAADVLPKLQPIIKGTSDGLETLLGDLSDFSKTRDFRDFVHEVGSQIGPDLVIGGRALGSFAHGVGDLLVAAGKNKDAKGIFRDLGHLADSFQSWAGSKGAQKDITGFFKYFHEIGPDVGHTIGSVADAVTQISKALRPIGPVELRVIGGIAKAIAGIPVPVLTALSTAMIATAGFQKLGGFKAVGLAGRVAGSLTSGGTTGGVVGKVLGRAGVVPVYVTNKGFGEPGGGGEGFWSKTGKWVTGGTAAEEGATAAGLTASELALLALPVGLALYGAILLNKEPSAYRAKDTDASVARAGRAAVRPGYVAPPVGRNENSDTGTFAGYSRGYARQSTYTPLIATAGKKVDELNSKLAQTTHAMDLVGHSSLRAFNQDATQGAQNTLAKLDAIGNSKGLSAFDVLGHSAAANSTRAVGSLNSVTGAVNRIPGNKKINVTANTSSAMAALRNIQAFQISDKSFTVTKFTNATAADHVRRAAGGPVWGPGTGTSDSIPAMLSNGEYVVRAAAVRHYGIGTFDRMNAQGYAAGGVVTGGPSGSLSGARSDVDHFRHSLHDATAELDKEKTSLQSLQSARTQLAQTVTSNFRSDLFAAPSSVWGVSPNAIGTLRTDIANARRYNRLEASLGRRGLSGGALGAVTTLAAAQQVAGYSPSELREYERLFNVRKRVSLAAGQHLGDDRFGGAIDSLHDTVRAQAADVHRLTEQQKHANAELAAIKKAAQDGPDRMASSLNGASGKAVRRQRRG